VSFRFNQEQNGHEPHPWLEKKVYAPLRQRTVDLVRRSVDALLKDKQRVSLAMVVAKSKEVDTEGSGKGISESAILEAVRKGQRSRSIRMGYVGLSGLFNRRRQVVVVPAGCREKSRWLQKPMETEQWKLALEAFSYSLLLIPA